MIRGTIVFLMATISLNALLATDEPLESPRFEAQETALLIAEGGDAKLVAAIQQWWLACNAEQSFLQIITAQPGPVQLDSGLRLLGNEVLPRITVPRWLIISLSGDMRQDFVMHALMRRALQEGATVWAVSEALPESLDKPDIRRAAAFKVVHPDYAVLAFQALAEQCQTPEPEEAEAQPEKTEVPEDQQETPAGTQ
jgi:hypothetical protein